MDFDKWIDLWAENAINRLPYAEGMFPTEIVGKDEIYKSFTNSASNFDVIRLPVSEMIVDEGKRKVIARVEGDMTKKDGSFYRNKYIFLLKYNENNEINECIEYFNPITAGKGFGLLEKLNSTPLEINLQESNKDVVRRYYQEVWNKKNLDMIHQTHNESWTHHDNANPDDVAGHEGHRKRMEELFIAFPDMQFFLDDITAENEKVVVRFTVTGTQQGNFGNIPPTGKRVRMPGYITHKLENGKIVEDWAVRDTWGLMIQLGVIQPNGNKE